MKRFLVPIIIFATISWVIWLVLLNFSSPFIVTSNQITKQLDNQPVVFFLAALFSALTFTFALTLYFFYQFIGNPPEDGRQTMRKSLRQSFFVSLGFVTLALLQLTGTLNLLTFILAIGVVIALEVTFHT